MDEYGPATYGDRWADRYDAWVASFARSSDGDVAADALAELAGDGRALELAIGTGRVALALAARGIEVHGIDASEAMVARLRQKAGGEAIPVTIADFADVGVEGTFRLVYVVFNTFFALRSQDDQVRCFANVAQHLDPDGSFVIEAFVPDMGRFDRGQRVQAVEVGPAEVFMEATRHEPTEQRIASAWIELRSGAPVEILPIHLRYAWPSELDLMARLAGLQLRDRWAGWNREPFGEGSGMHVSIYGRP